MNFSFFASPKQTIGFLTDILIEEEARSYAPDEFLIECLKILGETDKKHFSQILDEIIRSDDDSGVMDFARTYKKQIESNSI